MATIARKTRHVSGLPLQSGKAGGDPSPKTAYGLCCGIRSAVEAGLGREDLRGVRVAIQGVGNVGYHLCKLLHAAGATLLVSDLDDARVDVRDDRQNDGCVHDWSSSRCSPIPALPVMGRVPVGQISTTPALVTLTQLAGGKTRVAIGVAAQLTVKARGQGPPGIVSQCRTPGDGENGHSSPVFDTGHMRAKLLFLRCSCLKDYP